MLIKIIGSSEKWTDCSKKEMTFLKWHGSRNWVIEKNYKRVIVKPNRCELRSRHGCYYDKMETHAIPEGLNRSKEAEENMDGPWDQLKSSDRLRYTQFTTGSTTFTVSSVDIRYVQPLTSHCLSSHHMPATMPVLGHLSSDTCTAPWRLVLFQCPMHVNGLNPYSKPRIQTMLNALSLMEPNHSSGNNLLKITDLEFGTARTST